MQYLHPSIKSDRHSNHKYVILLQIYTLHLPLTALYKEIKAVGYMAWLKE